jgi:hypothetical protein
MLVFIDVCEMIVEMEIPDLNTEDYKENIIYKIPEEYSKIKKIYDIFENIIYDSETKNDELYTNFILTFVNKEIRNNEKCCYFYINKSIVYDKCVYYIFFTNNNSNLKEKYSISSYIKLYNDDNGNIFQEFYHNSGKIEGSYKRYSGDRLIEEINYINNKKEGKSYFYDLCNVGDIKTEFDYIDNMITHFIKFNNNNKIFEMNYDINLNKGIFIDYEENLKYNLYFKSKKETDIDRIFHNLSYYGKNFHSEDIVMTQF